jgi:DNA-binding response OmpR family regulator
MVAPSGIRIDRSTFAGTPSHKTVAVVLIRHAQPLQRITEAGDRSLILILSDINMPGMIGLELLPKAKAARPDVPIIMVTAYGDAETKRKALENGAEALLTKPIDFRTLRSEIDMRIERAAFRFRRASQSEQTASLRSAGPATVTLPLRDRSRHDQPPIQLLTYPHNRTVARHRPP